MIEITIQRSRSRRACPTCRLQSRLSSDIHCRHFNQMKHSKHLNYHWNYVNFLISANKLQINLVKSKPAANELIILDDAGSDDTSVKDQVFPVAKLMMEMIMGMIIVIMRMMIILLMFCICINLDAPGRLPPWIERSSQCSFHLLVPPSNQRLFTIHSKSKQIGGVYFLGETNWRKST